jgi:hypothetical protein
VLKHASGAPFSVMRPRRLLKAKGGVMVSWARRHATAKKNKNNLQTWNSNIEENCEPMRHSGNGSHRSRKDFVELFVGVAAQEIRHAPVVAGVRRPRSSQRNRSGGVWHQRSVQR